MDIFDLLYGDAILKPDISLKEIAIKDGSYTFDAGGALHPEEIAIDGTMADLNWLWEVIFEENSEQIYECADFSCSWSNLGNNVNIPDLGWINSGLDFDTTADVSEQITTDLPDGYSYGAHINASAVSEGFRVDPIGNEASLYYLGHAWIKVISGQVLYRLVGIGDPVDYVFNSVYSNSEWEYVRFMGRTTSDYPVARFYTRSTGGGAEWKQADVDLRYSLGASCVALDEDGNVYKGYIYALEDDAGTMKIWTDNWEPGYQGVTIDRLYVKKKHSNNAMWDFNETIQEGTSYYNVDNVADYYARLRNATTASGTIVPALGIAGVLFNNPTQSFEVWLGNTNLNYDDYFNLQTFTLEALFSFNNLVAGENYTIISKRIQSAPWNSFWMYVATDSDDLPTLCFYLLFDDGAGNPGTATGEIQIGYLVPDDFHYVTVSWDGRYIRGYIEGELLLEYDVIAELGLSDPQVFYETRGTPATPRNSSMYFGGFPWGAANGLTGILDEIRISENVRRPEAITRTLLKARGIYDGVFLDIPFQQEYMSASFLPTFESDLNGITALSFPEKYCFNKHFGINNFAALVTTTWGHYYADLYGTIVAERQDANAMSMNLQHGINFYKSGMYALGARSINFNSCVMMVKFEILGSCHDGGTIQKVVTSGHGFSSEDRWFLFLRETSSNVFDLVYTWFHDTDAPISYPKNWEESVLISGLELNTEYQLAMVVNFSGSNGYLEAYLNNELIFFEQDNDKYIISTSGSSSKPISLGNGYWFSTDKTFNGVIYDFNMHSGISNLSKIKGMIKSGYRLQDNNPESIEPCLGKIAYDLKTYGMFLPIAESVESLYQVYPNSASSFSASGGASYNVSLHRPDYYSYKLRSISPFGLCISWQKSRPDIWADGLLTDECLFLNNKHPYILPVPDNYTIYGSTDNNERFSFAGAKMKKAQVLNETHNCEFTLEMILRVDTPCDNEWGELIHKWWSATENKRQWGVGILKGMVNFFISIDGTAGNTSDWFSAERSFESNTWIHLMLSYKSDDDGYKFRAYINGVYQTNELDLMATPEREFGFTPADFDGVSSIYPYLPPSGGFKYMNLSFGGYPATSLNPFRQRRLYWNGDLFYMNVLNKETTELEARERYLQFKDKLDRHNNIEATVDHFEELGVGL